MSATLNVLFSATGHPPNPFTEVEMAKEQTRSSAGRPTHPFLEKLGAQAGWEIFTYSVKIVCGKQTEANCCCTAGTRPGVYATEVNIQNLNLQPAEGIKILKLVLPLIASGAVVAREPNVAVADPRRSEVVTLPPLGATMDDCCRIAEFVAPPSGDPGLTIAILMIWSLVELSVSAVYTATPLSGDGISIDVEYIPSGRLGLTGPGGPG
jgi:hypothetical protein